MSKKIAIITGDPNSINTEIIFKSYQKLNKSLKKNIFLIGSYELISKQFKELKYKSKLKKLNNINEKYEGLNLKIIDLPLDFKNPFKVKRNLASKYVLNSIDFAHKLASEKSVKGIINCPIDKDLLNKKTNGVTEYLANKCKIKNNSEVMLIYNKKFSVSPLTTHISVKNINKRISIKKIVNKSIIIKKWYKKQFNKIPKIGVLGLNPHNSELKKNSEEKKIIIPAVQKLKKIGVKVYGPLVSDSVFINEYKKYDVVLGMYHDQVLAPFKALYKFDGINVTLGLKYIRTSPDHGTALNIVRKNKAIETSLLNCIKFINKLKK